MQKLSDFLIVDMTHRIFEFIAVYKQYECLFSCVFWSLLVFCMKLLNLFPRNPKQFTTRPRLYPFQRLTRKPPMKPSRNTSTMTLPSEWAVRENALMLLVSDHIVISKLMSPLSHLLLNFTSILYANKHVHHWDKWTQWVLHKEIM